jgi:CDP-paratose 2-epimerase
MKLLVTGICGFVGSQLSEALLKRFTGLEITGVDNLSRRGSELNFARLKRLGCRVLHGDVRLAEDLADLPKVDWVLDCAAIPTVLAGLTGGAAQLVGNNLTGTLHLLEKCRREGAGLMILSSSRVYSIRALCALPLRRADVRLEVDPGVSAPVGFSDAGVAESFSTEAPVSLYGATKLASEVMAIEYGQAFDFPVRINRCGVIAGPGQFGRIDQGIFSYWVYQWIQGKPLNYIGFGGEGLQVRDFLSPEDLAELVALQMADPGHQAPPILNVGGGKDRSLSLRELSSFCERALSVRREIGSVPETRPYDIPYYVTDSRAVSQHWNWRPKQPAEATLDAIVRWARDHAAELTSFD